MTTPRPDLRQAAEKLCRMLAVKPCPDDIIAILAGDFTCMAYKHTKGGASLLNLQSALTDLKAALDAEKE